MANMADMARMMAAQGGMGGGAMTGGPEENPELEAPPMEDLEGAASDPMADLMGAVDSIEAAIPTLPEAVGEKLRQQVEALRAIVEEAGAAMNAEGPAPAEEPAPPGGEAPPPGAQAEEDLGGV